MSAENRVTLAGDGNVAINCRPSNAVPKDRLYHQLLARMGASSTSQSVGVGS